MSEQKEQSVILRWFRRLMPREDAFFDMFARHADTIVIGAEELRLMLNGGDSVATRMSSTVKHSAISATPHCLSP